MILIPQSVLRDYHRIFRRVGPKSTVARAAMTIHVVGGRDGVRFRMVLPGVAIEYLHPRAAEKTSLSMPMTALAECAGQGEDTVQIQRKNGSVEICWDHHGVPYRREYPSRDEPQVTFPNWPKNHIANDPSLLKALDDAMQIPTGGAGRLSLTSVQLRGHQGDIVATDGRQLRIQGGFRFPWKEGFLVPRTTVFAARELPTWAVVMVVASPTHVHFRIGAWTVALAIESSVRFPNVDAVIPKIEQATTCWFVDAEEAEALATMLDKLPAAKEKFAPITIALGNPVAIRARAELDKR